MPFSDFRLNDYFFHIILRYGLNYDKIHNFRNILDGFGTKFMDINTDFRCAGLCIMFLCDPNHLQTAGWCTVRPYGVVH